MTSSLLGTVIEYYDFLLMMVIEHVEPSRRGRWAVIMQMGSPIGSLSSTGAVLLVTMLPDDAFYSWGWRIPFLLSAALLVIGLYVRLSVVESPVFTMAADQATRVQQQKIPALEILKRPRALILACAVGIGPFALTAIISSQILAYALSIGYDSSDVVRTVLYTSLVALIGIPLFSAPRCPTASVDAR